MRIVGLDALRGLAALAVAVPHYLVAHEVQPAFFEAVSIVSVEIFFVLSGLVLAPQILQCLRGDTARNLLIFYCRRWMRTLPPYLIALCLMAMLSSNFGTREFLTYAFFLQNFASLDAAADLFPVAWSLSVEEWFYLLFPLFMFAMGRLGLGALKACVLFVGLFLVLKIAGAALIPQWGAAARRLVLFRLDSIAFGFLLFFLISRTPALASHRGRALLLAVFLATSSALAATMAGIYAGDDTVARMIYFYVTPIFAGSLIAIFYYNDKVFVSHRGIERTSTFLGAISYDVYLFHIPVMLVVDRRLGPSAGTFALYVAGVFALSCLIRLTIENKILAARPAYGKLPPGNAIPEPSSKH